MLKFKEGKITKKEADLLLRRYLTKYYASISKQYPQVAGINPDKGVGYLFKLRDEGKIRIGLDSVRELVSCEIGYIN